MRALAVSLGCLLALSPSVSLAADDEWKEDWEIERGFSIAIDSSGYEFPVALASVPEPGPSPDDPAYFVVELRGRLKVVSNDRTVRTFAEGIGNFEPRNELPSPNAEGGAAGICLDPANGFVFVTFLYTDEEGTFRNGLVRYDTTPRTFGWKPTSQRSLSEIFRADRSALSHQIGPCQVDGEYLYVSLGDGDQPGLARDPRHTNGKVLRMTLDGKPVPGNPFYEDESSARPSNYVWARGFRNPFGLEVLSGRVFVADNGAKVDRFLELEPGEDCLYDGSDWSIGARADLVFSPAVAPVTLERYPAESGIFPDEWADHFFLALAGGPGDPPGLGSTGQRSVVVFEYDFERRRVASKPRHFLRYRGDGVQLPVGLAFGRDALYLVPLMADREGRSAILRITYDPETGHPYDLADLEKYRRRPRALLADRGCLGCHAMSEGVHMVGPSLDRSLLSERIAERLDDPSYRETIEELNRRGGAFWTSYQPQRQEVLRARGTEQVRLWTKYHILEPRFDNPLSQMPNLGLSEEEATIITDYLVPDRSAADVVAGMMGQVLGRPRYSHVLAALATGGIGGLLLAGLLASTWRRIPSRTRRRE